ncbi:MAG: NUDIX hydrolase [Dehalococcoidia bacterium]|nr:NUDIX hydrolase [Dehalococcoidia bacterium]
MTQPLPVRDSMSAGGIVYRRRGPRIEVVLVGRDGGAFWALPKGRPQPGESLEQTALREVAEETGLEVAIVGEVGSDRYWFTAAAEGARVRKEVRHFLMEARGGDLSRHDGEYDLVQWFDADEALRVLTFPSQRLMLERALDLIAARQHP